MKYIITTVMALMVLTFGSIVFANEVDFDKNLASGKSFLVEVHAPWCPTCKAQASILKNLTSQPEFKDLSLVVIDFDSQKPLLKKLGVMKQSTLIVFKGGKEVERSLGDTSESSIKDLMLKAL